MTELPGVALRDFEDLLGYERGRGGVLERCGEEVREPCFLFVGRGVRCVSDAARHRGVDDAWFDERDTHAEGLHLASESLGEGFERPLGGHVSGERSAADAARDRTDVDDAAAASRAHVGDDGLNAAEDAEVVGLHGGAEFGKRKLFDGAGAFDAGVVDEHVDGAVRFVNLGDGFVDGLVGVDVHLRDEDGKFFLRCGIG